jgi:hypothetical protein
MAFRKFNTVAILGFGNIFAEDKGGSLVVRYTLLLVYCSVATKPVSFWGILLSEGLAY